MAAAMSSVQGRGGFESMVWMALKLIVVNTIFYRILMSNRSFVSETSLRMMDNLTALVKFKRISSCLEGGYTA